MKRTLLIFSFFLLSKSYAFDAVVIVLEAPLLKEPNLGSTVLQTLRKGARVYVPRELGNKKDPPDFIQTYDRVGNRAFIPKKYIKLITNDLSENKMPVTYPGSDPTDYRLEEPIPETYPFANTSFLRASVAVSIGNNTKSPYDYNSPFSSQSFSSESGARLNVTRKIAFDKYDRYYFGLFAAITTNNNALQFQNGNLAEENRSVIRLGPLITYDAFKNDRYRLTLGTGFTYNYHKSSLIMKDDKGQSEERLFSGYSLSPFANSFMQMTNVFPNIDLIGGADFNLYLPHTQKSSDEVAIPALWGSGTSPQISSGLKPQVSFFLGLQVRY